MKIVLGGSGGSTSASQNQNNILEFNTETEEWQHVGTMKEARYQHHVTVVSYDDYTQTGVLKIELYI